jgi:hypothetical protein
MTGDRWADAALILSALSIGGDPGQISLHDATMMESGSDALVAGGMKGADVMDKFQNFPASIVEEISRVVSSLSGLSDTDDEIVEKKGNS